MNFLGRGLWVATTALLLTALGFAQSNVAEPDQYGNNVFQTADRGQQGTDVFQTAGRDQYGNDVFQTADPQFMREATQDAMTKINLARVALQNAQNEQVKAFAQQILSDYGKTQKDLFNIAYQQIVVLPDTLDPNHLDTFRNALATARRGVRPGLHEGDAERWSDGHVEVQTGSDERR